MIIESVLEVGRFGTGNLVISNGGTVSNTTGYLARDGSSGTTDVLRLSVVPSAVPLSAAFWLFGSNLLGLVVASRRRREACHPITGHTGGPDIASSLRTRQHEGDFEIPENDRQLMKTWVPTDPRMTYYDPEESVGVEAGKLRKKGSLGKKRARCDWHYTSTAINADGSVAPCCAMFYKKDDFGKISASEDGRYMNVVNNSKFVAIRNHFSGRPQQPTGLVCDDCPAPNIMDYAKSLNRWVAYITLMSFLSCFARLFRILRPRSGSTISGRTAIDSPVPIQEVKVSRTPI